MRTAGASGRPAADSGSSERNAREPSESAGADANHSTGGAGTAGGGSGATEAAGSGGRAEAPIDETPLPMDPLDPALVYVAPETADARALELLSDWSLLPVLATGHHEQQSSRDRGKTSATESMLFSLLAYGNRDFNNFVCKSADADTGSGPLIGYQYDSPTCAESYVRGVVLARFEGAGQMTRLWLTSDLLNAENGALRDEVLRIYVDDNPAVAIQVPLKQVLSGTAGEIFTIPFGASSNAFIAWHYPVAFSRRLLVVLDHLSGGYYYQVDVVRDAETQRRVAPRQRLDQRDAAHALLVRASPVPSAATSLHDEPFSLAAGEQRPVQLTGPATIDELRLRVPKDKLTSLAGVRVSARWDGAQQAAIDIPLLDLFVASRAIVAANSLALAAAVEGSDQILSLRLPMPFQNSAEWTLSNGSDAAVAFQLTFIGEPKVPGAAFGHLNVQRNESSRPPAQLEQTVADVKGRGRFVGVCADLGGHNDPALVGEASNLDLLQGDFRATADGVRAIDSTGTEDYIDSAFYFRDSPKATSFAQNWGRVDDTSAQPPAQVSFCRWQVLGAEIDFQSELNLIHEVAQHDLSIVELHRTLAFLYLP
jgi:Protein of unknown function (DUF2961)